jgi:hypothetical protein
LIQAITSRKILNHWETLPNGEALIKCARCKRPFPTVNGQWNGSTKEKLVNGVHQVTYFCPNCTTVLNQLAQFRARRVI